MLTTRANCVADGRRTLVENEKSPGTVVRVWRVKSRYYVYTVGRKTVLVSTGVYLDQGGQVR